MNHVLKTFVPLQNPLTAEVCKGTNIVTKEYGTLKDFESGCWAAVLGHGRTDLAEVARGQMETLFHTHQYFDNPYPGELTQILLEKSGLDQDYCGTYLSSGSDAVSMAIMMAEVLTGRKRKLCFAASYLSTAPELKMPRNPALWTDLDIRGCVGCANDCSGCKTVADIKFHEYAAFVFEPGNAGGLIQLAPEGLITYLVNSIKRCGGMVVANEVTTGFGRTGRWFGHQHYSVLTKVGQGPDFIAMGKGLGNGYPISGVLMKARLAPLAADLEFRYVQSHTNDPLGCRIAIEVVKIIAEEGWLAIGASRGEKLARGLQNLKKVSPVVEAVRGRGLMQVAVLNPRVQAVEVFDALLKKGYFVGFNAGANLLRFYPPMIIEEGAISGLLTALSEVLGTND